MLLDLGSLLSRIINPIDSKAIPTALSVALPSAICAETEPILACVVGISQVLAGREHASINHACTTHSARDVRSLGSRSSQNRAAIKAQQIAVASMVDRVSSQFTTCGSKSGSVCDSFSCAVIPGPDQCPE